MLRKGDYVDCGERRLVVDASADSVRLETAFAKGIRKAMCSFGGCEQEVCDADRGLEQRMHFCQEHHDQLSGYIQSGDVRRILGFWVKANGGAKKLAATF